MRLQLLLRKVHYWLAIFVALPLLLIVVTGLLLQFKKQLPWVQPPEQRAAPGEPRLGLPGILEVARGVPELAVAEWRDVYRLEYRPNRRLVKIVAVNGWEAQLDATDGRVLQVAYRRSDAIEKLHDGSWFGGVVHYGLFVPAGTGLLMLLVTGVYLFLLPIVRRARRKHGKAPRSRVW
jgi:uncharacterized iron-regulated membrane protein